MNIPNLLSLARLMMVPFFPIVFLSGVPQANLYAAGIYLIAASTDVLDGYISRKYNLVTRLGRILDPLADKLMAFTVLLTITIAGVVHWWAISLLFLKELVMAWGAVSLIRKCDDVFAAEWWGKASTVLLFLVCMVLMIFRLNQIISNALLAVAITMNVATLIYYLQMYHKSQGKTINAKNEP